MRKIKKLTKKDFKKTYLKGEAGRFYWEWIPKHLPIIITLEPCLNGFCVGFYHKKEPFFAVEKRCTQLPPEEVYAEKKRPKKNKLTSFQYMDLFHTLPRSKKAWKKALEIANSFKRQVVVEKILETWKFIEGGEKNQNTLGTNPTTISSSPNATTYKYSNSNSSSFSLYLNLLNN